MLRQSRTAIAVLPIYIAERHFFPIRERSGFLRGYGIAISRCGKYNETNENEPFMQNKA